MNKAVMKFNVMMMSLATVAGLLGGFILTLIGEIAAIIVYVIGIGLMHRNWLKDPLKGYNAENVILCYERRNFTNMCCLLTSAVTLFIVLLAGYSNLWVLLITAGVTYLMWQSHATMAMARDKFMGQAS